MAGSEQRTGFDWNEVLAPAATVAVVAFVVLQLKEYFDAGLLDTPGTSMDALLIAGGMLVFSVVRQFLKKPPTS